MRFSETPPLEMTAEHARAFGGLLVKQLIQEGKKQPAFLGFLERGLFFKSFGWFQQCKKRPRLKQWEAEIRAGFEAEAAKRGYTQ